MRPRKVLSDIYHKTLNMPRIIKNYKVELNSTENLRDLLQDVINLSDEQIKQANDQITLLKNATDLPNEPIDGKAKYAKAINDYMSMRDKAISKKIDVAKMLNEVINHNGNIDEALNDAKGSGVGFSISNLRGMIDDMQKQNNNDTQIITLKK